VERGTVATDTAADDDEVIILPLHGQRRKTHGLALAERRRGSTEAPGPADDRGDGLGAGGVKERRACQGESIGGDREGRRDDGDAAKHRLNPMGGRSA
jgi:hypothetical protein